MNTLTGSKLNKKSPPNKHPKWRDPGKGLPEQTPREYPDRATDRNESPGNNCGVESIRISETFLLIRVPGDEYYGEFHGEFNDSDFPEELLGDGPGNPHGGLR